MDITAPMFVGHILVHLYGGYLVSEWGDDGFTDDEDAYLAYQVGVGEILKAVHCLTTSILF